MTKKKTFTKAKSSWPKSMEKTQKKTLTNKECDITKYSECYSMAMLNDVQYIDQTVRP